jgi:hypothetical protein
VCVCVFCVCLWVLSIQVCSDFTRLLTKSHFINIQTLGCIGSRRAPILDKSTLPLPSRYSMNCQWCSSCVLMTSKNYPFATWPPRLGPAVCKSVSITIAGKTPKRHLKVPWPLTLEVSEQFWAPFWGRECTLLSLCSKLLPVLQERPCSKAYIHSHRQGLQQILPSASPGTSFCPVHVSQGTKVFLPFTRTLRSLAYHFK